MCIVLSRADKDAQIMVRQIIESLAFQKDTSYVRIMVDCWVENPGELIDMTIMHPGEVESESCGGNLLADRFNPDSSMQEDLLHRIYGPRIKEGGTPGAQFCKRINCYRYEEIPFPVGNCIPNLQISNIKLHSKDITTGAPLYSTFTAPIPKGHTWFRFVIRLVGASYKQYVADRPHFFIPPVSEIVSVFRFELN